MKQNLIIITRSKFSSCFTSSRTTLRFFSKSSRLQNFSPSYPSILEIFLKLPNFKKISEMLGFDGEYPAGQRKDKFWHLCYKICAQETSLHFKIKPSPPFVNEERSDSVFPKRINHT